MRALSPVVPVGFVVTVVALAILGRISPLVLGYYIVASSIAFATYGWDKAAARRDGRRMSEASLIAIAATGGWPGAWLARQVFRHKTRKQPFRTYFWLAVVLNCGGLALLLWQLGDALA